MGGRPGETLRRTRPQAKDPTLRATTYTLRTGLFVGVSWANRHIVRGSLKSAAAFAAHGPRADLHRTRPVHHGKAGRHAASSSEPLSLAFHLGGQDRLPPLEQVLKVVPLGPPSEFWNIDHPDDRGRRITARIGPQLSPIRGLDIGGVSRFPPRARGVDVLQVIVIEGLETVRRRLGRLIQPIYRLRMSRVPWNCGGGPVSIRLRSPRHCARRLRHVRRLRVRELLGVTVGAGGR